MKKLLLLSLLLIHTISTFADDSGTCGDGVTYIFDESSQTLTISKTGEGSGQMTDYYSVDASPWHSYKNKITKIVIDSGVTSIGRKAFYGCPVISINIPSSVTVICESAFCDCVNLISVNIPEGVKTIGESAFSYCESLTSVIIPNSVSQIFSRAFSSCSALTSITIPNSVEKVGANAFGYCKALKNVIIGNSVKEIGKEAFIRCSSLNTVTVGESVSSIGESVFRECKALTTIKLPNSLSSIGQGAFYGCGLTSISIPGTIKSMGGSVFMDCDKLESATISEGLTSINSGLFRGCKSLTSVSIPESVSSIGSDAFKGCSSLTSMIIGNGVTKIDDFAFEGCSSLVSISFPECLTSIGDRAFSGCSSLNSLTLPANLSIIKESAFSDCSSLTSVSVYCVPKDISRYSVNHWFKGCSNLKEVLFDCDRTTALFIDCSSLERVILTEKVSSLDDDSFNGCSSLASINIPESVTSIGMYAFLGCKNLTDISLPNSITSIGYGAFANCYKLQSINIPEKIRILDKKVFKYCESLKLISIPSSVEAIYQEAFSNCNSLELINALPINPPFIYDNSFSNYTIQVKVPKGYKEAYQTAQGWMNFSNISDADKYKITYIVDGEQYKTDEIEEGEAITPEAEPTKEGYTFSGWSDLPETMPAKDITVTGTFTINKYMLTYSVDGEEYKSYDIEYGSTITSETEPTKEGYTFSGWSDLPETMPAKDVTVTGTFTINKYKVTYMIDGEVYQTVEVEYGSTITPPNPGDREGYDFAWGDYPSTMPAEDITINGSYTATDIRAILADESDVKIFTVSGKPLNNLQKGVNIIRYKDGRTQKLIIK